MWIHYQLIEMSLLSIRTSTTLVTVQCSVFVPVLPLKMASWTTLFAIHTQSVTIDGQ